MRLTVDARKAQALAPALSPRRTVHQSAVHPRLPNLGFRPGRSSPRHDVGVETGAGSAAAPNAAAPNAAAPNADSSLSLFRWQDPTTWKPGLRLGELGRYELGPLLGKGGAGIVYSVYDHRLRRPLAAKLSVHAPDPSVSDPLQAEARVMAQLSHPNIVRVHDCILIKGNSCLLMERINAPTLQALVAENKLSLPQALHVVVQVVGALDHMHSHGILHLDVKPSNLFITRWGQVKLFDFGVGARLAMGCDHALESFVVGTPGYMAPEQWAFESLDARADVWAVGILLHEVLFGRCQAKNRNNGSPLPYRPRGDAQNYPPSLKRIFSATLAVDPSERVVHVTDLLVPLRQAALELCEYQFGRLSGAERRLAAACSLVTLRHELTHHCLPVLKHATELSDAAVHRAWEGLIRRGVIEAGDAPHWGTGDALMQACFASLPEQERAAMATRLTAAQPGHPPPVNRTASAPFHAESDHWGQSVPQRTTHRKEAPHHRNPLPVHSGSTLESIRSVEGVEQRG